MPSAPTDKLAVCPELIVWLCGCVVIDGAVPAGGGLPGASAGATAISAVFESAVAVPSERRTQ